MAREKKLSVGAINIRIDPHPSSDHYVKLLQDAFRIKYAIRSRGDQHLILSSVSKSINDNGELSGSIARFTEIDSKQPWFDIDRNDKANKDDVSRIRIPINLKPNFQPFSFLFFPQAHVLVFEHYADQVGVSHRVIESFLRKLFNHPKIMQIYGEVNVDIIKDAKALKDILSIPHLKHLDIMIKKPNPDSLGGMDARVKARLARQNANKFEQRLTAESEKDLEPDQETKDLAKVGVNNGYVKGSGKNGKGKKVEISTLSFPKTETEYYDPNEQSTSTTFIALARKMLKNYVREH